MEFSRNLFEYGHRIEDKNPFLDALRSRKVLPIILTLNCTYKIVIKKWIETWLKLSRIFFAKKLSIESTIPTLKVSIQNFCFLSLSLWEMFAAKNIIQSNST